jgi:hypothetical protein
MPDGQPGTILQQQCEFRFLLGQRLFGGRQNVQYPSGIQQFQGIGSMIPGREKTGMILQEFLHGFLAGAEPGNRIKKNYIFRFFPFTAGFNGYFTLVFGNLERFFVQRGLL